MRDDCVRCGGSGGTCILIHDGSPHNREACRGAQWRDCTACGGTGENTILGALAASHDRLLTVLGWFIDEHPDPGTEALAAAYEARLVTQRVGTLTSS